MYSVEWVYVHAFSNDEMLRLKEEFMVKMEPKMTNKLRPSSRFVKS